MRPLALFAALILAPGCGDDGSSVGGDGGDVNDGGVEDGEMGLTDGATVGDGGIWYCPDPLGQQLPCACNDGMDNDADGQIDAADPGCAGPSDNNEDINFTPGSTQCTDGVDNGDGDGLADALDPECTGPLDDDESSFATGIPGDNMDECHQDCWFDGDSGAGNDGCDWRLGCDPVAGPAYGCNMPGPALCSRMQTDECRTFCQQLTPNGCDCFGCCDIFVDGVSHTVLLHPECSVEDIRAGNGDCVACTKVASCENTCDPCEYCIGHEPEPGCVPKGGLPDAPGCPAGQVSCIPDDPDGTACDDPTTFCLTGCCVPVID
jgi:hypothetical protein